jgi:hypothetical protein
LVSAPLATGNNGTIAAPNKKDPTWASMLRREVRRASPRAEFSTNESNHFKSDS